MQINEKNRKKQEGPHIKKLPLKDLFSNQVMFRTSMLTLDSLLAQADRHAFFNLFVLVPAPTKGCACLYYFSFSPLKRETTNAS